MSAFPWVLAASGWFLFAVSTWERLSEARQKASAKDHPWEGYTQRTQTIFGKVTGGPNPWLSQAPRPNNARPTTPRPTTNIAMVPPKTKAPGGEPGAEEP